MPGVEGPCELLEVDRWGNYTKKMVVQNRESVSLVCGTSNGVKVGLTMRRNGNYKEGRLLFFECPLDYYLLNLVQNIKEGSIVNI